MRVLQVIQHSMPFGVTQVCYSISNQLAKKGHQVTILTTDRGLNQCAAPNAANNVEVIPFHCVASIGDYLISPSIKKWLHSNVRDFDVIHMHDFRTYQNSVSHGYAKKYNIPYILQAHGSMLEFVRLRTQKRLYDLLWGRTIINDAATCVALTPVEREQYVKMGIKRDRIAVVPNGIDTSEYVNLPNKSEFRTKHAIDSDEKIVLFLGRLHQIKGADLLVKAFAKLSEKMNSVKLVLAGPNMGALPQLKTLARELKLTNKVLFVGPLYGQDKLEAYVDADVYVLPSVYELFPITVLEACACGTPIIVSSACGIADLVSKFGCVVERNADVLCDVMYRVLNNDVMRTDLGKRGRQFVERELSFDRIIKSLEEIYRNVTTMDSCTYG
jgi:glycosyltransferase involved in cell wall biosynthesis